MTVENTTLTATDTPNAEETVTDTVQETSSSEQTSEVKAEGAESQPETKTEGQTEEQKQGAPEKYELQLPEGSTLSASELEKTAELARQLGLSNEAAQALVDEKSKTLADFQTSQVEEFKRTTSQWAKQASEDPEIGGEGFKENVEIAHRVLKRFASPEFSKALNETGYGNHPEMIRIFKRIGEAMADDKFVSPRSEGQSSKSRADVLYNE